MDKKNKNPEIRFKEFTEDWEQVQLNDVTTKIGDGIHGTPKYISNGGVFFINGNNLKSGRIEVTEETKQVSESQISENDKLLNSNTILISINGTIGNIAKYHGEKVMLGKSVAYLNLKNINKEYVFSIFQSPFIQDYFTNNLTGSTIKNLGLKTIRETKISVPAIKEQSQIASFFQNLDNLITLHQKKYDKLVILKKAMLVKMFPKKGSLRPEIRFKGFTEDWEATSLGEIFNYERPDNYIVKSVEYSSDFNTPVLTANKGFILGYTNEKNTFKEECIIFDDFTLDNKYVDFHFMVKSSALKILMLKNKNTHNLLFSFNLLNTTKIEIMGHARHYISVVQNTSVLVPKIDEQKKIGQYFKNLDNQIALLKTQLDKLYNIKKTCFLKMFVAQD